MSKMRVLMLHSTIRGDEKLLIKAADKLDVSLEPMDIRSQILKPNQDFSNFDIVLNRCISNSIGMQAVTFFESLKIPVINSLEVAQICENKFLTSLRLQNHKVATIPFAVAFTEEQAIEAVNQLGGYPVVIKPVTGSWGRLLSKINDQDALEAVLEQKFVLGGPIHKLIYIQKYVEKKANRDIRVTMIGNKVICAIFRQTDHWITNTARGAKAKLCKVDNDLRRICESASKAVGGGVLGIDVMEIDNGYTINEVNHTTEFKNVQRVTGVNVAEAIINYCVEVASYD